MLEPLVGFKKYNSYTVTSALEKWQRPKTEKNYSQEDTLIGYGQLIDRNDNIFLFSFTLSNIRFSIIY